MDLRDLYRDVIVDHNRSPRNFRKITPASRQAQGFNPLCGDKLTVYVDLEGEVIRDLSFEGSGCAISVASASLMTEALQGKTVAEAEAYFRTVHAVVTGEEPQPELTALGKLGALGGVRQYPSRVKCASLAWHALHAALEEREHTVSTE